MKMISIVIPAYNEEGTADPTQEELNKAIVTMSKASLPMMDECSTTSSSTANEPRIESLMIEEVIVARNQQPYVMLPEQGHVKGPDGGRLRLDPIGGFHARARHRRR